MKSTQRLAIGSMIGPYKVVRLIGKGGMGEVYEAIEESSERKVALKVVSKEQSDDPEAVKRFENEGKALSQISHPNVVAVLSIDHYMSTHFIVMEYVEGISLDDLLQNRTFSVRDAFPLIRQVLHGVMILHQNGIIHRDLKTKNLIYQKDHSIKIIDFGVVKMLREEDLGLTRAGVVVGSIKYISPEVATGQPASSQSDIWSLGIIFYEMLTGQVPFSGKNTLEVLDKVRHQPLEFSRAAQICIPQEVRAIISKMCEKDVSKRYKDILAVLTDLDRISQSPEYHLPEDLEQLSRFNLKKIANESSLRAHFRQAGLKDIEIKMALAIALSHQFELQDGPETDTIEVSEYALQEVLDQFRIGKLQFREAEELILHRPRIAFKVLAVAVTVMALAFVVLKGMRESPSPIPERETREQSSLVAQKTPPPQVQTSATYQLKTPQPNTKIWIEPHHLYNFSWSPAVILEDVKLQISLDENFQEILIEEPAHGTQVTVSTRLEEGPYHWRLIQYSGQKIEPLSAAQSFIVLTKNPPKPLSTKEGTPLALQWEPKSFIFNYRLQVARDSQFRDLIVDQNVKGSRWEGVQLPDGHYYWRVSVYDSTPIDSLWSRAQTFQVGTPPLGSHLKIVKNPATKSQKKSNFRSDSRSPTSSKKKRSEKSSRSR